MIAGLFLAAAALAQAAPEASAYGPAPPPPPKAAPAKTAAADCPPQSRDANPNEIVVCAPKPEGYRIPPDVLAAKRAKKEALAGRPKPPEDFKDHSCQVVGEKPCIDQKPGIDLLAAPVIAAEIAQRLAKGQEVGSMFVTDPQLSEYQYYQLARKEREEKEAEAAAKATAAAAKAKAAAAKPNIGAASSDPAAPQTKP
jgi:hypothetical protein